MATRPQRKMPKLTQPMAQGRSGISGRGAGWRKRRKIHSIQSNKLQSKSEEVMPPTMSSGQLGVSSPGMARR